jgi:hypothetical protein
MTIENEKVVDFLRTILSLLTNDELFKLGDCLTSILIVLSDILKYQLLFDLRPASHLMQYVGLSSFFIN